MTDITLSQADAVIEGALAEARSLNLPPMTVAVLDKGGHLTALKREDRSANLRSDIAIGKAKGALGLGQNSRAMADRIEKVPYFFIAMAALANGNMIPVPGGVLIYDEARNVIGAVGLSGDSADNDEKCGLAGIAAAGLAA